MRLVILTLIGLLVVSGCQSPSTPAKPPSSPSLPSPSSNSPSMPSPPSSSSPPRMPSASAPNSQPRMPSASAPNSQPRMPSAAAPNSQPRMPSASAPNSQPRMPSASAPNSPSRMPRSSPPDSESGVPNTQNRQPTDGPDRQQANDQKDTKATAAPDNPLSRSDSEQTATAGAALAKIGKAITRGLRTEANDEVAGADDNPRGIQAASQTARTALDEALRKAGQTLETAGELLKTDADNLDKDIGGEPNRNGGTKQADIENAISEATVAILIAEKELNRAEGTNTTPADSERLGDAARLLVLANQAVREATFSLPSLGSDKALPPSPVTDSGQDPRVASIDAKLDASIERFESDVQAVRNALAKTVARQNSSEATMLPPAIDAQKIAEAGLADKDNGSKDQEDIEVAVLAQEPQAAGDNRDFGAPFSVPSDIPSPEGDDILASQLRELAASEPDPELREKYWEEYKRYKGYKEDD